MSMVVDHSGRIAIVGRPNVGKSTLMNKILGEKLSITSRKPQTTRHRLLGVKTVENYQFVYIDTPGLHTRKESALNRYLNRTASASLDDVDIILFVVDCTQWNDEDEAVLARLKGHDQAAVAVINKVDQLKDKEALLPLMATLAEQHAFTEIVPLSAQNGKGVDRLEQLLQDLLPEGYPFYEADQLTDRSERFLVAERIREKLTRQLGQELPYAMTVEIEQFKEEEGLTTISAVIWVERAGQKGIVIGNRGARLRSVGKEAREELELLLGRKIFLQLWVKVREGWSDDERALQSFGYREELD